MKSIIYLRHGHLNALIATVCLIALLTGCRGHYPLKDPYTELQPVPVPRTTLGPGDDIEIWFTYAAQYSHSQTVQPDGKISLPLLEEPDVMVQGKTPEELSEELMKRYTTQLKHPELTVIARSLYERQAYVGGEVLEPGILEFSGPLTALAAIVRAGGFNRKHASFKNVVVIRHKDGQRYGCALDFRDTLKGKEAKPFYLEPYDIVWVPRTTISKVNQWIDQYINKIVPQTGFLYRYSWGRSTIGMETDAYLQDIER